MLSLAALTPPWGSVLVMPTAISSMMNAARGVFTAGPNCSRWLARGQALPGCAGGGLAAEKGDVHSVQPSAVSLTQATEVGSVYTLDELEAIGAVPANRVGLHMDGARFANAGAAGLLASRNDLAARVDVLSFGPARTAMAAEAIVVFDPGLARELAFRRKRAGHLLSKPALRRPAARLSARRRLAASRPPRQRHGRSRLAHGLAAVPG